MACAYQRTSVVNRPLPPRIDLRTSRRLGLHSNLASPHAPVRAAACVTRHQQELRGRPFRDVRKEAQDRARLKKLVTMKLGKNGIGPNFHRGLAGALAKNEYVKVRFGNCEEDEEDLIPAITEENDCFCAHRMGSTATFYRDRRLPAVQNDLWTDVSDESQDQSETEVGPELEVTQDVNT